MFCDHLCLPWPRLLCCTKGMLPWLQSNLRIKTGINISDVISCWVITMIIVWLLRLVLQNWNGVYPPWFIHGLSGTICVIPDSKVHGANMGPIWNRQDPGGPHVGPVNIAIWDVPYVFVDTTEVDKTNFKWTLFFHMYICWYISKLHCAPNTL